MSTVAIRVPLRTAPGRRLRLDEEVVGTHFGRLFRAALALTGSRPDAEDLVQDTFARVLARPRFVRGESDLGYLLQVLRNTCVSRHRAALCRPQTTCWPDDGEYAATDRCYDPQLAAERLDIAAALAKLPAPMRDAVVAVDVMDLDYRSAAKALNVSEGTIRSRVWRGRERLAGLIER